jgi:predicted aminopeptidase
VFLHVNLLAMIWKTLLPIPGCTALIAGAALAGCADLPYYQQAMAGQWHLLQARQPVTELLDAADTPASLRQRLQTAQALRAFASTELALPDNGSYSDYADLGRPWVVKNVFAAPELSLEPRRWCFWLIGCLSYRGYFDAEAAQSLAEDLRAAGDDVYLADIPAYSTLGWFEDPLLNTFIGWPTGRLAELLFHELAHQRLYIPDDSAFNEAFATTVGQLGAQRWLQQHGTARAQAEYATEVQRREQFLALTTATREQLAAVYAASYSDAAKRAAKQRILVELQARYAQLKQDWAGYAGYDRWFAQDLNNAKLASVTTYHQQVPAFRALFARERGDFAAFYCAAEALGQLPPPQRKAALRALSATAPAEHLAADAAPSTADSKN